MRTLTLTQPGQHTVTVGPSETVLVKIIQPAAAAALDLKVELTGAGASARVVGVFVNKGITENTLNCTMHHRAPHTRAYLLVKGLAQDRARAYFSGIIKIEPGAQETESFLEHRALLAGEAEVYPTPSLEIGADQVKASHAAAVTYLDESDRFYLTARGILPDSADRLLIDSFLAEVLTVMTPAQQRLIKAQL